MDYDLVDGLGNGGAVILCGVRVSDRLSAILCGWMGYDILS